MIQGRGSWDVLSGRGADDVLYGDKGDDYLFGGTIQRRSDADGEDKLFGGRGDDCVYGGRQDDVLYGGGGSDLFGLICYDFIADPGGEVMFGGDGNDFFVAEEAGRQHRDVIHCGRGTDTVLVRPVDWVASDCEKRNPFQF